MSDRMRAFVLDGAGARLVRDRPRPRPEPGMVRVRSLVAGICNTDLEIARGYMRFQGILGHEFVGEALEGAHAGRRVVAGINFGCGACAACDRGLARHCANRRVLGILGADGALAEEVAVPERNLAVVPDTVDDEVAAFAEPVAAACEILEQVGSMAGRRALVVGDGKLGPLVAQVLASDGAEVVIEGHHLDRLSWIRERGIRLETPEADDRRYDVVVEATGSAAGLERAIRVTEPRGTLVLKTTVATAHHVDLAPVVIDEITIVGSRCGRMQPALERLADHRVEVRPLIDARFPLDRVEEAFARAGERGTRKVLVEMR